MPFVGAGVYGNAICSKPFNIPGCFYKIGVIPPRLLRRVASLLIFTESLVMAVFLCCKSNPKDHEQALWVLVLPLAGSRVKIFYQPFEFLVKMFILSLILFPAENVSSSITGIFIHSNQN